MRCQVIAEASGEYTGKYEREMVQRLLKPLRLTANAAFNRGLLH
jgi:hypothetical protein